MEDITPKLLKAIQDDFQSRFNKSKTIQSLYAKIRDGTATYDEANDFAIETGKLLSASFQKNLSEDILPNGKMYYNIANRILNATLTNNHNLIVEVTSQIQTSLNKTAGLGIKAIEPEVNEYRIKSLVNKVSSATEFSSVAWVFGEPVINFSQAVVDDAIQANANFQYNAGLSPKIIRKSSGNCCDWCVAVVGEYDYPDVPKDVWRRHDYCRCKVDYVAGKNRHNVHNDNTGKRRYVPDGYGGYEKSKEERIAHAEYMKATEKERAARAREKRIATWERKRTKKQ